MTGERKSFGCCSPDSTKLCEYIVQTEQNCWYCKCWDADKDIWLQEADAVTPTGAREELVGTVASPVWETTTQ